MSSFLSATANFTRQCNVRRDLKKIEDESRAFELALEVLVCSFLVCAKQEKSFYYSKIIIFIFLYNCDAVVA